jgi:hypothetical protein
MRGADESYSDVILKAGRDRGTGVTMRALIIAAVFVGVSGPAFAETLTRATSFQGCRVCKGADGYRSTEWQWQGMTIWSGATATAGRQTDCDCETTTATPPDGGVPDFETIWASKPGDPGSASLNEHARADRFDRATLRAP